MERVVKILHPGDHRDLYRLPESENVKIRPPVLDFMKNWENADVIDDYLTRNPDADKNVLQDLLEYKPEFIMMAALDFIFAKNTKTGVKEFLLLETNICPSGLYIGPTYTHVYETLLLSSFFGEEERWRMKKSEGGLAYLYGETKMDTLSIPHFMAEISQEKVYMLPWSSDVPNEKGEFEDYVQFKDGVMYVKDDKDWVPIRACFRWLNNDSWLNLPVKTMKTFVYPHPLACISTGRNKQLADVACKRFNEEYSKYGLQIRSPKTITGVDKKNMREIVGKEFGFRAIIKTPYSSRGRGIFLIRNESDVDTFLETDDSRYNLFVVQELVALEADSTEEDEFVFVGCETDGNKHACTFRTIICDGKTRYEPLVICGVNASTPFICNESNNETERVYSMYITNIAGQSLSKNYHRFISADEEGMKRMGIAVGDIVDAYVQSVMCMIATDKMSKDLMREDGSVDLELFKKLTPEEQFIREIEIGLKSELLGV